jgi:hypothetical protein
MYEIFAQNKQLLDKLAILAEHGWCFDEKRQSWSKWSKKSLPAILHIIHQVTNVDLSKKTESGEDAYTVYCDDGVFYGDMLKGLAAEESKALLDIRYRNHAMKKPYTLSSTEEQILLHAGWVDETQNGLWKEYQKQFPSSGEALIEFKNLLKRDFDERFYPPCDTCSYGRVHSLVQLSDSDNDGERLI